MSLTEDLKKPVNVLSLAVGVIGILLSVWFYYQAQQRREVAYLLSSSFSLIYDAESAAKQFTLLGPNGERVAENVYLANAVIWNSGDVPLEPEEIREPVKLVFTDVGTVLSARIVGTTHGPITRARLTTTTDTARRSAAVAVDWAHLDPNFGFKIQVIFSGSEEAAAKVAGSIVNTVIRPAALADFPRRSWIVIIPLGLVLTIIMVYLTDRLEERFGKRTALLSFIGMLTTMIGAVLIMFLLLRVAEVFRDRPPIPL